MGVSAICDAVKRALARKRSARDRRGPGGPRPATTALELTVRGIILGALITLVFTAANVYWGSKSGSPSPRRSRPRSSRWRCCDAFRNATIWENNIVQTVASAAGTLSSIMFVLPGLVMIGWWTGFPFWQSFGICVVGGILGVMYSVPLRRAMVTGSDLPYPEGVAAAEVLRGRRRRVERRRQSRRRRRKPRRTSPRGRERGRQRGVRGDRRNFGCSRAI